MGKTKERSPKERNPKNAKIREKMKKGASKGDKKTKTKTGAVRRNN